MVGINDGSNCKEDIAKHEGNDEIDDGAASSGNRSQNDRPGTSKSSPKQE